MGSRSHDPAVAAGPGTPVAVGDSVWSDRERAAFVVPPAMKPSQWAELYRHLHRGSLKGPWRNDNAPYARGIMDIIATPGVVQGNVMKGGQLGGSELVRSLMGFWAHTDPDPVGLTLPSMKKGRQIVKSDVLPLFRRTPVLRELIGSVGRDTLLESISLINGFQLDLMWSGSSTSMASNPYRRVFNDEVDKFDPWDGEEPDAIAATEVRLTSFGDRRLQINTSTPTTTAGTIHRMFEDSAVKLLFHVPCPHCGRRQVLRWPRVRWIDARRAAIHVPASSTAVAAGLASYVAGDSRMVFDSPAALAAHHEWLLTWSALLESVHTRKDLAYALASQRERAVWYQCEHCERPIYNSHKAGMVRQGLWTTVDGFVVDAAGERHADAEAVTHWPAETRVGFQISALYCLWMHWGTLAGEWLRSQDNPSALFFFVTNRLAEPFEFKLKRSEPSLYSAKCRADRGALPEGIVPRWAYVLLCTVDTQPSSFYVVVRAWGGGMRSARIWHGKLLTFDELDRLLFVQSWPVEGNEFQPMTVGLTLIDSGGTADRLVEASRTRQVYDYAIARQPMVRAIKGASRPGGGLYWAMRNPMSEGGKSDYSDLRGLMVDTHQANDLLSAYILAGMPPKASSDAAPGPDRVQDATGGVAAAREQWLLNLRDDPEYDAHMAGVQKTVDPRSKVEIWTPIKPGTRHDYRDCEAYQVIAAAVADVHMLPEEDETLAAKRAALAAQAVARQRSQPSETPSDKEQFGTGPL